MLPREQKQLKPLSDQLTRVKDLTPPDFGSLEAWEKRAIAAGRLPNGDASTSDMNKPIHGQGSSGTPMPFLGETKVEVALAGGEAKKEEGKEEAAQLKVLPPWMIRQGMQLTASQRGESRIEDVKAESGDFLNGGPDAKDVKPAEEKEETQRKIQEEYLKAYYAALLLRQQEVEQAATATPETELVVTPDEDVKEEEVREVGTKAKREDDEDEDEVEWEDAGATEDNGPPALSQDSHGTNGSGLDPGTGDHPEDDDEDEEDWEEG